MWPPSGSPIESSCRGILLVLLWNFVSEKQEASLYWLYFGLPSAERQRKVSLANRITTERLFKGKGFNSIQKDIFFPFQVQLIPNTSNMENFHIVIKQAEMCMDVRSQFLDGFLFPPTNTGFDWMKMHIGYTKAYYMSIFLLSPT